MKVYKAGTRAITQIGEIAGFITAVTIREDLVVYEFSYFINGERRSEWMQACELNILDKENIVKIGFLTKS